MHMRHIHFSPYQIRYRSYLIMNRSIKQNNVNAVIYAAKRR
ncbi:hypothetical protein CHCC14819_4222 [Bacillus licheniformis]|nr:hypothetical protein CHCC14819_4222 [Bacillus licheniformis]TWO12602.1 hypothetical protein CHCC14431_3964 [Bacillus licheniformis]